MVRFCWRGLVWSSLVWSGPPPWWASFVVWGCKGVSATCIRVPVETKARATLVWPVRVAFERVSAVVYVYSIASLHPSRPCKFANHPASFVPKVQHPGCLRRKYTDAASMPNLSCFFPQRFLQGTGDRPGAYGVTVYNLTATVNIGGGQGGARSVRVVGAAFGGDLAAAVSAAAAANGGVVALAAATPADACIGLSNAGAFTLCVFAGGHSSPPLPNLPVTANPAPFFDCFVCLRGPVPKSSPPLPLPSLRAPAACLTTASNNRQHLPNCACYHSGGCCQVLADFNILGLAKPRLLSYCSGLHLYFLKH